MLSDVVRRQKTLIADQILHFVAGDAADLFEQLELLTECLFKTGRYGAVEGQSYHHRIFIAQGDGKDVVRQVVTVLIERRGKIGIAAYAGRDIAALVKQLLQG